MVFLIRCLPRVSISSSAPKLHNPCVTSSSKSRLALRGERAKGAWEGRGEVGRAGNQVVASTQALSGIKYSNTYTGW